MVVVGSTKFYGDGCYEMAVETDKTAVEYADEWLTNNWDDEPPNVVIEMYANVGGVERIVYSTNKQQAALEDFPDGPDNIGVR
jgi:hypothetical protein